MFVRTIKIILISVIVLFITSSVLAVLTPNDPLFDSWDENNPQGNNWGQEFIKLPSAWDIETGSVTTKVAVIDDGFDINHEDLKENISVVGPGNIVQSHGTHVAGIIGARGNNEKGIAGTMWNSGLILYSTVIPGVFPLTKDRYDGLAILPAMKVAIIKGAKIINLSAGQIFKTPEKAGEQNDTFKEFLFKWVEDKNKDVLFVFSAGNEKKDFIYNSPSSLSQEYDNVVSVAASDQNGNLPKWSNYGEVSIAAPGKDIYSTLPGDNYGTMSGTSMSAPFVSGLAGLIWSKAEEMGITLTAKKVKDLIVNGAIRGGKYVFGPDAYPIFIINAYESLNLLVTEVPPVIPFADITLDGNPGDWTSIATVCIDAESDDNTDYTGADIKSFKFAQDEDFIYIMADFYDGVPNEVLGQAEPFAYQFHFTSIGPTGGPSPIHIDNLGVFYDGTKWDITYLSVVGIPGVVTGSLTGSSVAVDSVIELKVPKNKLPDTSAFCLQIGTGMGIDGVLGDITEWRILSF